MAPSLVSRLLAVALVVLVVTARSAAAADCTATQVAEVTALTANATASCGSDAFSSTATTATYCGNSKCVAFMTSIVATVPYCEIEGYNVRTTIASAISLCDSQSDAVPANTSAASSLYRPAASSSVSVLLVAAAILAIALAV